jgi:hypothetical protein
MAHRQKAGYDLETVARELVLAHREQDPSVTAVYISPDPNGREIRLIEVSTELVSTNEIFPVRFTARDDLGIPFPSTVVLISTAEWEALQAGELELPASWNANVQQLRQLA